MQIIKKQNIFF